MQRALWLVAISAVLSSAKPCSRISSDVSTSTASSVASVTPSSTAPSEPVSTIVIPSESSTPVISSTPVSSSTPAAPTPTNVVANSGFEDQTNTAWSTSVPDGMTAAFGQPPYIHSGSHAAMIIVRNAVGAGRISQPLTLEPYTTYTFSAWAASSASNPGCDVSYYIGSPDGTAVSQVLATVPSAQLGAYVQSTATYTSGADTDISINAMVTCSQLPGTHGFYFDDISLIV